MDSASEVLRGVAPEYDGGEGMEHKNVRVCIVKTADMHRSDMLSLYDSDHNPRVIVCSFDGEGGAKTYRGALVEMKATQTFVAENVPLEMVGRVHLPWSENGEGEGTDVVLRPWHFFVSVLGYESFVLVWNAAALHPARADGGFAF